MPKEFDLERWDLATDLERRLRDALETGSLPIDLRGHYASGTDPFGPIPKSLSKRLEKDAFKPMWLWEHPLLEKIYESFLTGNPMGGYDNFVFPLSPDCSDCGQRIGFQTDGVSLRAVTYSERAENVLDVEANADICKYPDGTPAYTMRLECPSGILVMDDDLREFFKDPPDTHEFYVNNLFGIVNTSRFYEDQGMLHGFVGNSCPGIYRKGDVLLIGNPAEGEETLRDEDTGLVCEEVGYICTDLWWYSIADGSLLAQLNEEQLNKRKDLGWGTFIPVTPGTYEIRQQHHRIDSDDYDAARVYARIHLVK